MPEVLRLFVAPAEEVASAGMVAQVPCAALDSLPAACESRCIILHQKVGASYDVFDNIDHVVGVVGGHFSKSTCFFIGGTPRDRGEPRAATRGSLPYRSQNPIMLKHV